MTNHRLWGDPPFDPELRQSVFNGKDGWLSQNGLIQFVCRFLHILRLGKDDVTQVKTEERFENFSATVDVLPEGGLIPIKL